MEDDLPFHFWTLNERFRAFDEELPSFDAHPDPEAHPLRLHTLRLNRREDASIFVPGRSFLPSRNQVTIRQRIHRPEAILPPAPRISND